MTGRQSLEQIKMPRGRPPCSAQWDGEKWVIDPGALEIAAIKLEEQRIKCRDRKRATKAALRELKPQLFKHTDQTKLTDLT